MTVIVSDKEPQTVTADGVTAAYGGEAPRITASTDGDGELSYAVKSGGAVTVDAAGGLTIIGAGSAVVTVTAAESDVYARGVKDVEVVVLPREVLLSWTGTELTYNGEAQAPAAAAGCLVGGDECTVTVSGAATNAGSYTAAASLSDPNYCLPANAAQSFTINPRVTLQRGGEVICTAASSDLGGGFTFADAIADGVYDLVAECGDRTVTVLTEYGPGCTPVGSIDIPGVPVQAVVTVKGAEALPAAAGGLTELALALQTGGEPLKLELALESLRASAVADLDAILTLLKQRAPRMGVQDGRFYDAVLTKTVGGSAAPVSDTGGNLIQLVFPFPSSKSTQIEVLRLHDGSCAALTPLEDGETPADGRFCLDSKAETLTIYTDKFSLYAIFSSDDILYPVAASAAENGAVTLGCTEAAAGETVTFTVTADEGYTVSSVTAADAGGAPAVLTELGGGQYRFTMPASAVTVTAVFEKASSGRYHGGSGGRSSSAASEEPEEPAETPEEPACDGGEGCPLARFSDLDPHAWYHDGVHHCLENGIMNGMSDDEFRPGATASRAMIVTMLWRLEGSPVANYAMSFEDVAADSWYAEAVRWAQSEGIVTGMSEAEFAPNRAVTREELAAILYRYAQSRGEGFTGIWMFLLPFEDAADISAWADEAVHWCYMNGIVTGRTETAFVPGDTATRAETAAMFQRFCEAVEK